MSIRHMVVHIEGTALRQGSEPLYEMNAETCSLPALRMPVHCMGACRSPWDCFLPKWVRGTRAAASLCAPPYLLLLYRLNLGVLQHSTTQHSGNE